MNSLTIRDNELNKIYDIHYSDSFDGLKDLLVDLGLSNKKVCVVSETNVAPFYLETIKAICDNIATKTIDFVFKAGEESKTLDTVRELYVKLIEEHFDRNDILIALGGGVTGDLTGYAAATYLRGIDFIQIPTSLLAQVDSSVGGKTGVDFSSYKNMVGAFHQPAMVYINLSTLKTLPEREYLSGMGEVIKYGLIKDNKFFDWIKDNHERIIAREYDALLHMVMTSVAIKGDVVQRDFKESGERALLNFGHTLGHAIEKRMNFSLLHGECVAIGSILASYISFSKGLISFDDLIEIENIFKKFDLATYSYDCLNSEEIILDTKSDKKMIGDKIKFILLNNIGEAYIDKSVNDSDMLKALKNYI